jgi:hypothetical protein
MFRISKSLIYIYFILAAYANGEIADRVVYINDTASFQARIGDNDCHFVDGVGKLETDDFDKDGICVLVVTWSAVWKGTTQTAGSFPKGNVGRLVKWKAPNTPGEVEIIATVSNNNSERAADCPVTDKVMIEVSDAYRTSPWIPINPSGNECSWHCADNDLRFLKHDGCGNELKISCSDYGVGAVFNCAWEFYYNGFLISRCLFPLGSNDWYYKIKYSVYTAECYSFYRLKHVTQDGNGGDSCPGYSCAKITYFICEMGSFDGSCWRKVPIVPGAVPTPSYTIKVCEDGSSCPGGH